MIDQDFLRSAAIAEALSQLVEHRVAQRLGKKSFDDQPEHEGARLLGQFLSSASSFAGVVKGGRP